MRMPWKVAETMAIAAATRATMYKTTARGTAIADGGSGALAEGGGSVSMRANKAKPV